MTMHEISHDLYNTSDEGPLLFGCFLVAMLVMAGFALGLLAGWLLFAS